jgi:hypothetical protein
MRFTAARPVETSPAGSAPVSGYLFGRKLRRLRYRKRYNVFQVFGLILTIMKIAAGNFPVRFLSRPVIALASLIFFSMYVAAFAQELSISALETLINGGVAQRRITEMIKERGINFDLTDESREKLKKAGAGPSLMQSLELAGIRFRLRAGAKTKPEVSTKADGAGRHTKADSPTETESSRITEPGKRVENKASSSAPSVQKPNVPEDAAQPDISPRKLEELPPQIRDKDKGDQVISLRNLTIKDDEVSGELVNNSRQTVFGVQLQVLYSWRWNNDFHPGANDPGRADNFSINREIPPRQSVPFSYKPSPPLPQRKDGSFDVSVKVIGFSKLFQ